MPLITCPKCHHHVSSVASTCPRCSYALGQRCWEQIQRTDLVKCKKCRGQVAPEATVCRNCGVLAPTERRVHWLPVLAVAAVATVVIVMTGRTSPPEADGAPIWTPVASNSIPVGADTAAAVVESEAADEAVPVPEPTPPVVSAPLLARAPAGRAPAGAADPVSPSPRRLDTSPRVSAESDASGVVKWTSTWVNVRSGRSSSAPVVLTLDPRERVDVDDLDRGWWAAYVSGRMVGYVANSVLVDSPSDSLPAIQ